MLTECKYRILVIDDQRTLQPHWFAENSYVHYATTPQKAINELVWKHTFDDVWWDYVFFDYDLGMMGDEKITVDPVLDLIQYQFFDHNPFRIKQGVVHSMNPVGKDRIIRTLRHCDIPWVIRDVNILFEPVTTQEFEIGD